MYHDCPTRNPPTYLKVTHLMKLRKKIISLCSLILVAAVPASYAEDKHHHDSAIDRAGVESLSPELRNLLKKEMQAIQKGMMSIVPAYASGNWQEIKNIASKIEHSYILKQSISQNQITELHSVLPSQFIKLDQQFHYYAGMLSHVAEKEKSELVGFYIAKLSESCVSCHSQYATHKFQNFIQANNDDKHSH